MKFAKIVFAIAGIYGLITLAPMYFLETTIAAQSPPAMTHPEFFYGFIGVGLAWQVLFLMIARDPARLRLAMIPSVLEKVSFGASTIALYAAQRVTTQVLALSCVDLLLAALFVASFVKVGASMREDVLSG